MKKHEKIILLIQLFLLLYCSLRVLHPQFATLNGISAFANCKLST